MTGPWGTGSIVYTGSGNISSQRFGTARTDYAYDSQNRLSGISGAQTAAYQYDDYGNIASDARYHYEYDEVPNLRCVSVSTPCSSAADKIEYAYDGQNHRVTVTRDGMKTYEFHDAKGQLLMEFTPTQGNRLVQYYYLGGKRVAQQLSGQVALTVAKTGTGSGTVTSNPTGIDCGTVCSESYNLGQSIILSATPTVGSTFTGWSGACSGTAATCTVTMTTAQNVTAAFAPEAPAQVALTVTTTGTGSGVVTSNPMGIDCGADCSESYNLGQSVILSATPAAGSTFTGWSGACSGAATTCTVTMTATQNVTAAFAPSGPVLGIDDVSKAEGKTGKTSFTFTVTLSPASTNKVTVDYATADGTATAGSNYTATSGTLTFRPGQTSKTVTVSVKGDTAVEPNETFYLNLSTAVGATILDAQGVGTILNDD